MDPFLAGFADELVKTAGAGLKLPAELLAAADKRLKVTKETIRRIDQRWPKSMSDWRKRQLLRRGPPGS